MSQALVNGFRGLLTASQGAGTVYADVSGRLYEGMAPENESLPALVYILVTDDPDETFSGDDIDAEMQVDLWGEKRLGAAALGAINDKLFTLLQNATPTITGYSGGYVRCIDRGQRTIEDDAHRIMSRWQVRANTT